MQELQRIDDSIDQLRGRIEMPSVCGVSSMGTLHPSNEHCPNAIYDEDGGFSCAVGDIYRQKHLRSKVRNAPELLQFYWTTRQSPAPVRAIRDTGLIYTYQ